ncbi:MAG TPA: hypothetical protein DGT23_22795 [Micromonosporaceae bacterium]|nr:hypothetical protein [Micromonosporaceae bacterium]
MSRATLFSLPLAALFGALMAKPAFADNCDIFINPADCQNTGWTIGVIATAGGVAAAATAAAAKGKPKVTETKREFKDCNEAVSWLNSSTETGQASSDIKPTVGKPVTGKTDAGPGHTATVDVKWKFNPDGSTTTIEVPEWPNMTPADKAAVQKYKDALKAHEDGHHKVAKDWAAKESTKITGEGATPEEARADLQRKLEQYQQDAQQRLDGETAAYDAKTSHGANQSAVGGQDVKLTCPG